jgi:DNA-nicking Smr family endonuclease
MGDSKTNKGSLADQLAGLSISVKDDAAPDEQSGADSSPTAPPPPPTDEELFQQALAEMSDEEVAEAAARHRAARDEADDDKGTGATLGDALGDILRDVKPVSTRRRAPTQPEPPATPRPSATAGHQDGAGGQESRSKPRNDRELFEAAVEELSPGDIYRGKYFGQSDVPESDDGPSIADFMQDEDPPSDAPLDEEQARENLKNLQNQRMLEHALGGVDKLVDSSKYRKKEPRGYSSEPNDELNTEPLPKSGEGLHDVELQPLQKELLKRYNKRMRSSDVPELNLRGDTLDDALRRLELFCHDCWKRETGFVRVIHGKGKQSDGEPVIKPAVLNWLEGPGFRYVRGYAPEVKRAGNYGSIIVELARKKG